MKASASGRARSTPGTASAACGRSAALRPPRWLGYTERVEGGLRMPSPFPGMDPYLEDPAIWSDFHGTFLIGLRAELNKQLPVHYVARWDRHVWIDEPDGAPPRPLGRPDLFVAQPTGPREEGEQTAVLAAPATATMPTIDPKGKPYLKILDTRGRRVVTVVDVLSPSNKESGRDREAYRAVR